MRIGVSRNILLTHVFLLNAADVALRNELTLTLTIEDVVLFGSVLLKMAENALSTFPLRDISNYNCWLATLLPKPDPDLYGHGPQLEAESRPVPGALAPRNRQGKEISLFNRLKEDDDENSTR